MSRSFFMPENLANQNFAARSFPMKAHRLFYRENGQVYAIVWRNQDLSIVSDVWFDRFDSQAEFRRVLERVFDLFCENKYSRWLADMRFMTSGFAKSEYWLVNKFMPAMFNTGLERHAVILPNAAFSDEAEKAHAAVSKTLDVIADERVRGFNNIEHARRWLLASE